MKRACRWAGTGSREPDLALPRVAAALRTTSLAASGASMLIGVLVIAAWVLNVDALMRVLPGLTAMNLVDGGGGGKSVA